MKTLADVYNINEEEGEGIEMPKEAEINWDWLETKNGLMFLKKLNKRVKYLDKVSCAITCVQICCPFNYKCDTNCGRAFIGKGLCPCSWYKAPVELAIILSDYYDMINEKI